jgi:peptide/nickel transport system substrate-binding protein
MQKMIKKLSILGLLVLFWSCSESQLPQEDLSRVSFTPQRGGKIVIGISRDVDTFNPLYSLSVFAEEIGHLMLPGLADLDENSEFVPELATSWESSPDNMSLTYHLRRDVKWSDGHPFSAYDVKFTYDVLMNPEAASPKLSYTEMIKRVEVIDSFTVKFEFKSAYPYEIFDTAGSVLPKHLLENVKLSELKSHPFGMNPLSLGPYKLKRWVKQQVIELEPNEFYYDEPPFLDKVIFKIVTDQNNLLTQLQTGEIDMMIGVPPAEADRLTRNNPHIKLYPVSGRVYYYIGYNTQLPQFADANVRRALTMAIDRDQIIKGLMFGYARPCTGPIPPLLSWAYNDTITPLPYNLQQASALLTAAGWQDSDGDGWLDKDGQKFEFTIKTDASNGVKSDLAVIVQDQLKKVGVKVNVQLVEWTTYLKQLEAKDFEAHIGGWSSSLFVDPTPIFHSSATNIFNYTNYANPVVDSLIEAGRDELDRAKAADIWKKFQTIVYHDQPYTFLFWIDKIVAVNDRFENVKPIPLSSLYEIEKWFDKQESVNYAEK